MNPITFGLIIELLILVAKAVPKLVPGIQDLLKILRGETVEDISKEEAIARIDAAIASLP